MKTSAYRIEGMHCEGCARTLEALVGAEPGVERVSVSFKERDARVEFDPQRAGDAAIVAAIERAGYKVVAAGQ